MNSTKSQCYLANAARTNRVKHHTLFRSYACGNIETKHTKTTERMTHILIAYWILLTNRPCAVLPSLLHTECFTHSMKKKNDQNLAWNMILLITIIDLFQWLLLASRFSKWIPFMSSHNNNMFSQVSRFSFTMLVIEN